MIGIETELLFYYCLVEHLYSFMLVQLLCLLLKPTPELSQNEARFYVLYQFCLENHRVEISAS